MEAATKQRRTYADYAALPEGAPYQLIDGDLVMSPSPNPTHQRVVRRLMVAVQRYLDVHPLGELFVAPLDVYLSETETYQPDLFVVMEESKKIIAESKIEGAPDLVIEVLSPTTGYFDLTHKKDTYASFGVKEYWIVDPTEKWVEVFENSKGEFLLLERQRNTGTIRSRILPGFELQVESIF
jgi:Uma2 family endonuclease